MAMRDVVATALVLTISSAHAAHATEIDVGGELRLAIGGRAEVIEARYDCGTAGPVSVSYINADPNHLAVVPVEGRMLVFASAISASGSRYTAGQYEWWEARGEAALRDLTAAENAEALMRCKVVDGK